MYIKLQTLFEKASPIEQQEILSVLSESAKFAGVVKEFVETHQARFIKPPAFGPAVSKIENTRPVVTIQLITEFGIFTGTGRNSNVAKLVAIENAWEKFKKQPH